MSELVYGTPKYIALKQEALSLYGVIPTSQFDVTKAIRMRIDYLKNMLLTTQMKGYVLGISGGVDSTTAGRLAQIACEELRNEGYFSQFIAVRLPAGIQLDEADAQEAIKFINADKTLTINIGEVASKITIQGIEDVRKLEGDIISPAQIDFHKGNLKARLRMSSQYLIAGMYSALVLGTDHSTEGICGFWTKWGDGSCDSLVLDGLNKTQVRLTAKALGAPEFLWSKVATADLEELSPQKTDESALGIDYSTLDLFLEGYEIEQKIEYKIIKQFSITQHKRQAIPGSTTK